MTRKIRGVDYDENALAADTYAIHQYGDDDPVWTVMLTDKYGEKYDLNAEGEPCCTKTDCAGLVRELCEQGAYDIVIRDRLIQDLEPV